MVRLKRETRNQLLKAQRGPVDQFLGNISSQGLCNRSWGMANTAPVWRRCYGGGSIAEAAKMQDIGVLQAWNANAISDETNRSGQPNQTHDYQ